MATIWKAFYCCSPLHNSVRLQPGPVIFGNSGVIYGKNHRVLRAQQLQKKGNQVDPSGTTRESDPVRHTSKEVGVTETIGSGLEPGSWSRARRLENVLHSRRVSSVREAVANGA